MAVSKGVAGQRSTNSVSERNVLFSVSGVQYFGGTLDATNSYDGGNTGYEQELRAGTILAQVTSTKKWVPCKRTLVNMADATTTSLVVDDARAFKSGDVISVGSDTSITISAINYTTNTLTIASTAVADNEVVICTSLAGSEIPRGILNEYIKLTDEDGTARDKEFSAGIYAGAVKGALVLGDLAACRAATNYFTNITFASDIGQA